MEIIGEKIAEIRKRKGLTQEELSELAKINLRTLQRIEKGISEPRGNTLRNLCEVLEVNMEELLDYGKSTDEKYLMYFHLSVLTFVAIPMGNILLPMVLWLTKRDKIKDLNEQGVNLLNYQIMWSVIYYLMVIIWAFFKIMHLPHGFIFLVLVGLLYVVNIAYPIVASVSIGRGKLRKFYFSPFRFVSK